MKIRLAIALLVVGSSALLSAQVERLTIRMVPAPNQTLHVRTSMDMTMSVTPDPSAAGGLPIPPVGTRMITEAEHTSTVGPTDAKGHYQARVVCDSATYSATMNGQQMPANGQPVPGAPPAELIGAVVTFTYDDEGKVIDVATDAAMPASMAEPLKQILTSVMGAAPPMTLSVGESVTIPTQLSLPLPTAPNIPAMTMAGEMRYTLTSVTFDGADRIAHLKVGMTNTMTQGATVETGGGPAFSFEVHMNSEGTSDVNVDRGIVLHNEQRMTLDGAMRISAPSSVTPGSASPIPPMLIQGTINLSADLTR